MGGCPKIELPGNALQASRLSHCSHQHSQSAPGWEKAPGGTRGFLMNLSALSVLGSVAGLCQKPPKLCQAEGF